jgi:hypothetical protein
VAAGAAMDLRPPLAFSEAPIPIAPARALAERGPTSRVSRYRYYKCNTRIGKGIDYCQSENLPMQQLDALVLNSLADRVFTAARVRLMLESLGR